jgi:hypothetical protein
MGKAAAKGGDTGRAIEHYKSAQVRAISHYTSSTLHLVYYMTFNSDSAYVCEVLCVLQCMQACAECSRT